MQRFHEQFQSNGLVVLGLNGADDPEIARRLLRENGVTFANVLDSSDTAQKVVFQDYRAMAVPLQYFIDREGTVVDVWGGDDEARTLSVLEQMGVISRVPVASARRKKSRDTTEDDDAGSAEESCCRADRRDG